MNINLGGGRMAKGNQNEELTRIAVDIPDDLVRKFKSKLALSRKFKTQKQLIIHLLEKWLKSPEK